ncbi:hypothetical protein ISF_02873 [Cordyceps fumosorosea ARSEF 2679]|uniref:Uncharacterized protein n=1 Tax=Cordyceps fumosorosea (strain ARSEF 2679) TaxID=1081104 RepID=A0A168B4F6_CORFA|nr:hypothetical protein ISF_02873 [Cordyceps fumosorosea ARSEF 2679]OAA69603.1 hypothetical protein ISF_02873 [Cordyceps fumosorosea ARSEF 2679]
MDSTPLILPPATPAAFLSHILDAPPPPNTTVLICAARSDFLRSAVSQLHDQPAEEDVLRATLSRVAVARRVRVAFAPSVAHLRAHLSASVLPGAAHLLVYGLLDLHRGGGWWSAQAIGCSAACLVEAATRAGSAAVMMEPTGWKAEGEEKEEEEEVARRKREGRWAAYEEQIPLLSSTAEPREDGTWGVPCTSARVILQRWFTFDDS